MGYNATVDADKCVGCGECVDVCPVEVYELQDASPTPSTVKNAWAANPAWKCANTAPSPLKKRKAGAEALAPRSSE